MEKYLPFIMLLFAHKLHSFDFDWSLHIVASEPIFVQNIRPVPLTVCKILDIMYYEVCCCLHVN